MKKILSLLTGVMLLAFTACSDDDDVFKAEVKYPNETEQDMMTVEVWASEYPIAIQSDGAWHIEKDERFIKVEPAQGTGDAEVTLTVQNNQSEYRKYGKFRIVFDGHEEKNREITVEQKYTGDYDDNAADKLDNSNRIYGVGYSFNAALGKYGTADALEVEVLDTKELINLNQITKGPVQMEISSTTASGSSIAELSNDLAVKANCKGGFGKFKAEASTSFDMSLFNNSNYEFASTYYNVSMYQASCEMAIEQLREYLTDDAYDAINGYPRVDRRGRVRVDYPTDDPSGDSFKRLIDAWGTHVVVKTKLGGRVRHAMTVDISNISSSYDIKAFASASYGGLFVSGGASVDEKYKTSLKENSKNVRNELTVLGGDANAARALAAEVNTANLTKWQNSIDDDCMTLVEVTKVYPIYELIDLIEEDYVAPDGKTYHIDGKDRMNKLKKYMETGIQDVGDYSSYDCGTVTKIKVPSFPDYNGSESSRHSLIETVKLDGQIVAFVCNEYIPNINYDRRVTVIYPARNNNPCFNMGFFIGGYGHKPARVSWDGTNVAVQEYPDMDFGAAKEVYLRGATVYPKAPEGTQSFDGKTDYYTLEGMDGYKYPTVKIFNNIWMREDYSGTGSRTGGNDVIEYVKESTDVYYPISTVKKSYFAPSGWRAPTKKDYEEIQKKLEANAVGNIGATFWANDKGILGYNAWRTGWWDGSQIRYTAGQANHLTIDGYNARIQKNGVFAIVPWNGSAPIKLRLIKEF